MVEDQADLEMSHTVMAAFALCHADARAGGRRLRLVCVLGSQVLVRLVARRTTGVIPIRFVLASRPTLLPVAHVYRFGPATSCEFAADASVRYDAIVQRVVVALANQGAITMR